ncbi:MAG: PfkB family carbohydrate kinase [Meiothermus sp.]|uniref:PfkB family carbohydrate kinase n=1 Tax=Meiothermus sp. TaxID=1955249 RepID=UPI00298F30BB|nr:PfkB family carbohydrate kinase [Meiothermus sp.]MDW8481591.1 PfkB family carbohydrate kinase [Meiothermus sp.]
MKELIPRCAPLVQGENGVYFISLKENGERDFTCRRANSAASKLAPEDLDPQDLASTRMVLLSGITQAISPSAEAATLRAAQLAHSSASPVAYDPNYRPALWNGRGGLKAAQRAFEQLRPYVDVLLPSYPARHGPARPGASRALPPPCKPWADLPKDWAQSGRPGGLVGLGGETLARSCCRPYTNTLTPRAQGIAW